MIQEDQDGYGFQSLEDCQLLAKKLSQHCTKSRRVAIGLYELLANAVEHGNLAIGYDLKRNMLMDGNYLQSVEKRRQMREYRQRVARVLLQPIAKGYEFHIYDEGNGFDWSDYMSHKDTFLAIHGRGIAIAKTFSFDEVEYVGCGNQVIARVNN